MIQFITVKKKNTAEHITLYISPFRQRHIFVCLITLLKLRGFIICIPFFLRPFSDVQLLNQENSHRYIIFFFRFSLPLSHIAVTLVSLKLRSPPVKRQAVIRNAPDALHTDTDILLCSSKKKKNEKKDTYKAAACSMKNAQREKYTII